ncbi:hypothetical protein [Methyloversatilis thermotolerans]|uniref:hypothetical protein n=1 Tax=Methyloversatilis thermotolerans TaxID=1346290 RepID=UPI0018DEE5FA|nr:hypothetical protein [Methyloversatilis thermotolerans]
MPAFREFEKEAIRLMAANVLSEEQLRYALEADRPSSYNYTGSGYFLTVKHTSLPLEARTLSDPPVVGNVGEVQAGFVVFLGDQELTLECHTWGAIDVPEDFRDQPVVVSTPPVNLVDLRNAT